MLHITHTEQSNTLVVAFQGELDQHTATYAIDYPEDLLSLYPCDTLILNLAELSFMDSSGLAVVLHLSHACSLRGRHFLVFNAPPQAMRVFQAAGLPRKITFRKGEATNAQSGE